MASVIPSAQVHIVDARVTQLSYCVMLIISAILIWRNCAHLGMSRQTIALDALLLMLHIAIPVIGEFALNKLTWTNSLIYLVMTLVLSASHGFYCATFVFWKLKAHHKTISLDSRPVLH